MASQSVESHVMLEDVGLLARFFRGAKWYGAEWYITVFGGVILVLILFMTILAPHLAPHDPVKSVGSPFTAPGEGRQVLIVRTGEESIQGPGDLDGVLVGVRANSTGQFRALELGAEVKKFYDIEECFQALAEGQVGAIMVEEALGPQFMPAYGDRLKQVGEPFGRTFALGTDNLGRDILSRIIFGARAVLLVAVMSASFSALVGVTVGLLSGFVGGTLDRVFSLIMDSIYSFPGLILAIAMAAVLQLQMQQVLRNVAAAISLRLSGDQIAVMTGTMTTTVAIAVVYMPTFFRMVRGQVLAIKQQLYVEAARSLGAKPSTLLFRYVFPNVIASIVVIFSVNIADAILTEAGLSFIGLGLPPPTPDWGYDISKGRQFLAAGQWWMVTFPGLMIVLVAMGFSMFGEGLSEILNPRLTEA
jgi:peptide/nickel transport system permease protein